MTSIAELRRGCAFITGGGSGIGTAMAFHAGTEIGIPVAVADIRGDRASATATTISKAGGEAVSFEVDVTSIDSLNGAAESASAAFGDVTLIGANAGVESFARTWETEPENWRNVLDINVNGVFNTVHSFLPKCIGSGKRSHVLVTSSIGGIGARPSMAAYVVSKHAVRALADCLRLETAAANLNIGVSCLLPGPVKSRIADDGVISSDASADEAKRSLQDTIEAAGMNPDVVAKMAFDGIGEDKPNIYTHKRMADEAIHDLLGRLLG